MDVLLQIVSVVYKSGACYKYQLKWEREGFATDELNERIVIKDIPYCLDLRTQNSVRPASFICAYL